MLIVLMPIFRKRLRRDSGCKYPLRRVRRADASTNAMGMNKHTFRTLIPDPVWRCLDLGLQRRRCGGSVAVCSSRQVVQTTSRLLRRETLLRRSHGSRSRFPSVHARCRGFCRRGSVGRRPAGQRAASTRHHLGRPERWGSRARLGWWGDGARLYVLGHRQRSGTSREFCERTRRFSWGSRADDGVDLDWESRRPSNRGNTFHWSAPSGRHCFREPVCNRLSRGGVAVRPTRPRRRSRFPSLRTGFRATTWRPFTMKWITSF